MKILTTCGHALDEYDDIICYLRYIILEYRKNKYDQNTIVEIILSDDFILGERNELERIIKRIYDETTN